MNKKVKVTVQLKMVLKVKKSFPLQQMLSALSRQDIAVITEFILLQIKRLKLFSIFENIVLLISDLGDLMLS